MNLLNDTYQTAWAVFHDVRLSDEWHIHTFLGGISAFIWKRCGYKQWPGWTTIVNCVGLPSDGPLFQEFWEIENQTDITKDEALARYAALITKAHGRGMMLL